MPSPDSEIPPEVELAQAIGRDKRWMLWGVVGLGVIMLVVGAIGWGYSKTNNQVPISNNQTIVAEIPKESPKLVAEIKPVFAVWNGSGVAGAAGKLAEKLKSAGYDVVETKTAPNEQVGTTIELTRELLSQKDTLIKHVGPAEVKNLGSGLEYNVKVIIGK